MMNHKRFQAWLAQVDQLSAAQRGEAEAVLSGGPRARASLAAIEAGVGEDRRCPHCGTPGAVSRGKARGLRRYRCKGCGKTFNAATGTPLAGLHRKERWLESGTCPAEGETVRASAGRCGPAVNTAFRWRHRFPAAESRNPRRPAGIVEADETYVPESRRGARHLDRKARRRGGGAGRRGLSSGQVPVLVAADRGGMTASAVLPAVNADALREPSNRSWTMTSSRSVTDIAHTRPAPQPWASATKRSTCPGANGFATPFTSRRSTVGMAS